MAARGISHLPEGCGFAHLWPENGFRIPCQPPCCRAKPGVWLAEDSGLDPHRSRETSTVMAVTGRPRGLC